MPLSPYDKQRSGLSAAAPDNAFMSYMPQHRNALADYGDMGGYTPQQAQMPSEPQTWGQLAASFGQHLAGLPNALIQGAWSGLTAPRDAYQGRIPANEMLSRAMDTSGLASLGGYMSPKPRGSIGMGGGGADDAARAAYMAQFRPETVYHGTAADFTSFDPGRYGGATSNSRAGQVGVSAAFRPDVANEFAELASRATGGDPSVMPLRYRSERQGRLTLEPNAKNHEVAATLADAWDAGYDSVVLRNYTTPGGKTGENVVIVRNPNQLRSPNAAFDPAKRDSADLMAANSGPPVMVSGGGSSQPPDYWW